MLVEKPSRRLPGEKRMRVRSWGGRLVDGTVRMGGEWMAYKILVLDCSAVCSTEQINYQIRQVQVTCMFCREH